MTPEFANAADPVFEFVLDLLDRVEQGSEVDVEQEQQRVVQALTQAANRLAQDAGRKTLEEWEFGKFALVCWVDEMITGMSWALKDEQRNLWIANPLQLQILNTTEGGVQFYLQSKEAYANNAVDALEVFYLCVILGFRGFYEQPELVDNFSAQYQLPKSLDDWKDWAAELIRNDTKPKLIDSGYACRQAEPLTGRQWVAPATVLVGVAFVATVVTGWILYLN